MGILDLLRGADINRGLEEFNSTSGAVLLDVRSVDEYRTGHIPGSKNIPLDKIEIAIKSFPNKDTPMFLYCVSGSRSSMAAGYLKKRGYSRVKSIGGIGGFRGKLEV